MPSAILAHSSRVRHYQRLIFSKPVSPFILYGELYTTYHEVITSVVRKTEAEVDFTDRSIVGDVAIPTSGENMKKSPPPRVLCCPELSLPVT